MAKQCPACGGSGKRERDTMGTGSVICFWCGGRGEVAGKTIKNKGFWNENI